VEPETNRARTAEPKASGRVIKGSSQSSAKETDAAVAAGWPEGTARTPRSLATARLWEEGHMREVPVERIYREVRLLRLYEGSSEIQRLIIGGSLYRDQRKAAHHA
jgi:alkylation response protein AidB-like acyl-CoA dehydrogenase